MEVFLYNSTVCRLCGAENDSGTLLYSSEENNQNLCEIINAYLPLKVSDDGQLPRTICPGCTIQLEATVEFLNLIITGQKTIRRLHETEIEYKKSLLKNSQETIIAENIIYEINTSNGVYKVEHPISLQVSGLEKPKRKRGRPPKNSQSQEVPQEVVIQKQSEPVNIPKNISNDEEEPTGKRRRKAPTRFKEAVQGKELERIFLEEGVIDEDEKDDAEKPDVKNQKPTLPKEPEVIGHLAESGELVVIVKGKGRGRPKGRMRQTHEECPICGMEFTSVGRYMSHVAQHGKVQYRCDCGLAFTTRLSFSDHQKETEHTGRTVEPYNSDEDSEKDTSTLANKSIDTQEECSNKDKDEDNTTHAPKPNSPEEIMSQFESKGIDMDETAISDKNGDTSECPDGVEVTDKKPTQKLKCRYCDKVYNSKQSRSVHIKAAHQGERSHVCSECGAAFAYPRSLALHRIAHRRSRPSGFACDLCGKVLNHPSSVIYHKQTEHASQRYVCGTCGKTFRHKQLLQRHQLVHSEARPYSCKMCNASFKTKPNLLNHQLLHTGLKRFSCEVCKAMFAHKTSLTLHMRWHTGVKPYACNVCGKSFTQKGNLSEHQRIHSGEKPFACPMCPRRFTTASQHRLHVRRHPLRMPTVTESKEVVMATPPKQYSVPTKPKRQRSLLVCDKPQESGPDEEQVIYVAYEAADSRGPSITYVNADQAVNTEGNKLGRDCELYTGSSLLVPHQLQGLQVETMTGDNSQIELETEQIDADELQLEDVQLDIENGNFVLEQDISMKSEKGHLAVTDEDGRPLRLTMEDGTHLAITSMDGNTLQVITQDGQTIPVEINEYNDEVSHAPEAVLQQLSVEKSNVPTSITYFTIANVANIFKK